MPQRIRVGDVMTRKFVFVSPEDSLHHVTKTMIKNKVGSVVVKEKEDLKGIIARRDVVWALYKKKCENLSEIKAKDISTKKLVTIRPEANLDEALEKMNKKRIRRLPVISNKKIIGYITMRDMLKIRPSLYESLSEYENIKEEEEKLIKSESAKSGIFIEAPCEDCGNFDILDKIDGRMICESCRDVM